MEILGVGPQEFIFIVIIAIIFLGGKGMRSAGLTVGRWLNWFTKSELGITLRDTALALSNLPTKLMREANVEEWRKELELPNTIEPRAKRTPQTSSLARPKNAPPQKSRPLNVKKAKANQPGENEDDAEKQDG